MKQQTFALVDCNNFYASCEKLFRPDLANVPVVVLSNNDGCVVARSKEAKELGIKMAVPLYQVKDLIQQHKIKTFSSNYALYADISSRVMRILENLAPRVEVYSIDEAFLDLTGIESINSLLTFGQQVKQSVLQCVGIHVCVGIAPTKTLAKLANHAAKKYPATGGVVDLTARERQQKLLAITPVNDIWGVGRRITKRLESMNIHTALDLANSSPSKIRRQFSVVLERTVLELNGTSCIELEEVAPTKQQIISSRSFGSGVTDFNQMHEAIAQYTSRATEKLRLEKQQAKTLTLFIHTNPYNCGKKNYSNSVSGELTVPSSDTRDFVKLATHLLNRIWRDGYSYNKGGVMLSDFYHHGTYPLSLFEPTSTDSELFTTSETSQQLMAVLDEINQRGLGRLFLTGEHLKHAWNMKQEYLSPAYTTRWSDLPKVK
ncbi:translesion error-prone DNA polymerase V subunit UmuC [Aliidiomarina quisquiliarum]|uniref:translesion error-prone DNA polymerase V subunit UmuC n=1 Tax=Aliidiomarina quisquiliarum TaxID=2938947 RepID=UPI00208EF811|nr:translesion error-prone DNA polymerase V subunit UmuC [Aliidiomarina quisquiliarum]MCO4321372.1 translesion error-prone DNA polymerase V subunit UmuC [Aliidiomarina quisquiliarum]